jgi:hypothetical protein
MLRYISIAIILLFSAGLFAQKPDTVKVSNIIQKPDSVKAPVVIHSGDSVKTLSVEPKSDTLKALQVVQNADSTKAYHVPLKEDPLKNLPGAQKMNSVNKQIVTQKSDSVKGPRIIRQWHLSSDFSEEINIPFDTVFSLFNRSKIADKYSPVNATLGNYGLPFYQINFFDRITDPDEYLYKYYYPFMYIPEKATFTNTQVPFTELVWSFAGPIETSEQTFRVRHSQNVNRFFNFGLIYDVIFSLGQYSYQRSEDKTFSLYSSYTGAKYKLYFSAGINNLTSLENGGVIDNSQLKMPKTRDIPVNLSGLNKANSVLKNRNILLVQRYTLGNKVAEKDSTSQKVSGSLGLSGTFSHIFTLENNKRSYSDAVPGSGFYDTTFISNTVTFDSAYSKSIKNTVRFDFTTNEKRKFRLGIGVGIRNEIFRYSQIIPTHDTATIADTATWNRSNNAVVGRLFSDIGDKFRWLATGELYLSGYKAGDFMLNGEISKSFDWKKGRASWLLTGSFSNRQPSFWYDRWGSNNFEWHNNFNKELRMDVGSAFLYPARKTEVKVNYAIIKNYTDFDTLAFPSQYSGALSIAALTVKKEVRLWKFHLATDLMIQKSSNLDVLDLPLVTVRSAGYFEHLFRFAQTGGRLNTQLGADITYYSLYHPYAYMPATGRFFRQEKNTAGDYPFINLFLNFKVKRTRVFVMFDHMNAGSMGFKYEQVPYYPMNIKMFRYGLAWTFYN